MLSLRSHCHHEQALCALDTRFPLLKSEFKIYVAIKLEGQIFLSGAYLGSWSVNDLRSCNIQTVFFQVILAKLKWFYIRLEWGCLDSLGSSLDPSSLLVSSLTSGGTPLAWRQSQQGWWILLLIHSHSVSCCPQKAVSASLLGRLGPCCINWLIFLSPQTTLVPSFLHSGRSSVSKSHSMCSSCQTFLHPVSFLSWLSSSSLFSVLPFIFFYLYTRWHLPFP